jgi:hypothetical protein
VTTVAKDALSTSSQSFNAIADINTVQQLELVASAEEPTMTLSALGGNLDIVDFSLPSYTDAISTGSTETKKMAPTFNPFGDFSPEIVSGGENLKAASEEKAAADAAKAEEQAAAKAEAEARKAEDRAAKEARRVEEKAASEAAKAAREADEAAKKAQRQAQIEEQREKQRAVVERQNEAATSSPKVKEDASLTPPTVTGFDVPDIKIPDFKVPDMPSLQMPDMSAVKMPDMSAVKMPEFTAPEIPKVSFPKFNLPSMPVVDSGISSNTVKAPSFEAPKVNLPDLSVPKPFGGSSGDDFNKEPQKVRDEKAREARQVFLAANDDAKEAEAAAKAARALSNDKKSLAAQAKDEACSTRPGGKLICLRNPFTSGY